MIMKNLKRIFFLILLIFYLAPVPRIFALDTESHKEINQYIGEHTVKGFSLDLYLKNQLGFPEGKNEIFDKKKVYKWLGKGGEYEDEPPWTIPYLRSVNHFHDPTADDISKAGYSGIWEYKEDKGFLEGDSAALWAQKAEKRQDTGGNYSWWDIREYFEKALRNPDKKDREDYFVKTFRGLGQLMHLVADMSVPEHTRNDGHVLRAYEAYVKEEYAIPPIKEEYINMSVLKKPGQFAGVTLPIANLFDGNVFDGTNPDITANSDQIGLAEYTCVNFVSKDTLFSKDFTYPDRDSVEIRDMDYEDPFSPGTMVNRRYYWKIAHGETGYRLAGVNYLYFSGDLDGYLPEFETIPPMDDYVFQGYAERLLPRAIDYAAALLAYFFRGNMDLVIDQGFCRVANQMDECMEGFVSLYYDAVNGERKPVKSIEKWDWSNSCLIYPFGQGPEMALFAVPEDAENPGEYLMVFEGNMGLENEDAVAAATLNIPAIRISLPEEGYYALVTDQACADAPETCGFDKIVINAENISPRAGEMSRGTVSLVVKYRAGLDDQFVTPPGATSDRLSTLCVVLPDDVTIPAGTTTRLEFDLAGQQIPLWATDVHLFLTYVGDVGENSDMVCLGYRDISEPSPFDIFNVMDKTCLYGNLYDAGSAEAIEVVDKDDDGIADEWDVYAHAVKDVSVKFGDCTDCDFIVPYIDAGESFRMFALVDYDYFNMYLGYYTSPLQAEDPFLHGKYYQMVTPCRGLMNQFVKEDFDGCPSPPCRIRYYPVFDVFRDVDIWTVSAMANASYPTDVKCTY